MDISTAKVAIVHDILNTYGGAERVVEALLETFPKADLFVSRVTNNSQVSHIAKRVTKITFMQYLPWIPFLSKLYTPLYQLAFESIDLRKYDVIISSTAHFAKGVITNPSQLHICYCHTPPRFLYGYPSETAIRSKSLGKFLLAGLDHNLRDYDYIFGQRPDYFLTNSVTTQKRIEKFYRRTSTVINPPVETTRLKPKSLVVKNDSFLVVSRLVGYKNVKTVIDAFNQNGLNLMVVGDGPQKTELHTLAKSNISFSSFVSEQQLVTLYKKARALVFASSDEDFGIVPVEALAAGTPVIAFYSGGVTETVKPVTGVFYMQNTYDSLNIAVNEFLKREKQFSPDVLIKSAEQFSKKRFIEKIEKFVEDKLQTSSHQLVQTTFDEERDKVRNTSKGKN